MNVFGKIKEVGTHGFIYSLGSVAQSAVTFFLIPILTRQFNTEEYGVFTIIELFGLILGSVFYLGVSSAVPRSYFDYENQEERKSVFTTGFYILLVGAALQILFSLVTSAFFSKVLFDSEVYSQHLLYMSGASVLNFVSQYFLTFLRLLRKSVSVTIISFINMIISVGLTYYLLVEEGMGLWAPIYGKIFAFAFSLLALLWLVKDHFCLRISKSEIRLLLSYGVPTVFSSIAGMSIDWSDRFFINELLSASDVGVYSLGYRLGSIINVLLIVPFVQIWNPMMVEYRTKKGIEELFGKVLVFYFLIGTALTLILNSLLVAIGPMIIESRDFFPALKLAPVISIGILVNGSVNIVCAGLIYSRKINYVAKAYYFLFMINAVLNYFFIKTFNVWGAVASSMLTYFLAPILVYRYSSRFFKFPLEKRKVFSILISGLFLNLAIIYLSKNGVSIENVLMILLLNIAFGFASCYFFLDVDDRRQIRQLIVKS